MNFERSIDAKIEHLIGTLCERAGRWSTSSEDRDQITKEIARLRASLNPTVKIDR